MSEENEVDLTRMMSENHNRDQWRTNWRNRLSKLCSSTNIQHMISIDLITSNFKGILKNEEEVTEMKGKENGMELMIVNLINHSMRILRGGKGEELIEVDLSELKENEIIDLNDEGRRWEGGVLKGEVFGYGCLYDEDNGLEYEGWMIDGIKRCYGIEYWNDIGIVKYEGCYYNGMKHGYGLLYDRCGNIEYNGLFNNDSPFLCTSELNTESLDCINSHTESIKVEDDSNPDMKSLCLCMVFPSLKRLEIGNRCMNRLIHFSIDSLPFLESLNIRNNSFCEHDSIPKGDCLIMNCPQLREVVIGDWSFFNYDVFELKNLPSLESLTLGSYCFQKVRSFELKGKNE